MKTRQMHISLFEVVGNTVVEKNNSKEFNHAHKDLVKQSQAGSSLAQYQLYKLYSQAMYNTCLRMMKSQTEAQDLLQEAFCEAFMKLDSFRFESSFGSWLKRIVVNTCINAIKKRKADLIYTDNFSYFPEQDDHEKHDDLVLDLSKIKKAIENLSDGYRTIFSLYLLEGYDHSEIAEILNISESTSRSQYIRAKRKVKEQVMMNSEKHVLSH